MNDHMKSHAINGSITTTLVDYVLLYCGLYFFQPLKCPIQCYWHKFQCRYMYVCCRSFMKTRMQSSNQLTALQCIYRVLQCAKLNAIKMTVLIHTSTILIVCTRREESNGKTHVLKNGCARCRFLQLQLWLQTANRFLLLLCIMSVRNRKMCTQVLKLLFVHLNSSVKLCMWWV